MKQMLLAAWLTLLCGCVAGPPTYGVGPYTALNARDAETALVQKSLVSVGSTTPFDNPVRAIRAPMPDYPVELRNAHIQGKVVVRFTIDKTGVPSDFAIVESPHRGLSHAAENAVKLWRFEPVTLAGTPIAPVFDMPFNFQIP